MKKTLLALGLALIASSSFAYNGQIDGGFTYFDYDDNVTDSSGAFGLQGTLYFNPVNAKHGPLNEAAFLGHNSNVYARYNYDYLDTKTIDVSNFFNVLTPVAGKAEFDTHTISAGIEYYYEQFYLNGELGFAQDKVDVSVTALGISASESSDDDTTHYRALAGFLPVPNLLLAAGIDGYQGDNADDDDNRFALKAKYVTPLSNGQSLSLEADGAFGDADDVSLGADYYFNPAFSLGAEYRIHDDGEEDIDVFAVRTKYFVNSNFAVGGAIGFGDDINAFNINASIRF